ncbi:tRNAHis guanylyltransferase [Jaminaea rosea]|uniref:tRNA(His) guanylyltransferase n=1 Tax=Jaminaea rosea TaxID=1569628 RepID=A0A316V4F7_9BASI|nr:tRNAHis guanylyltransferase [Jaminaea rosea]PWN30335.1 tRNAHis guanylyltransferase [Jaminaea rosea]
MAGSRFAYVRDFELPDPALPDVYLVVRIDGKGFHKFSAAHNFAKPNDAAALELMNCAARQVCSELRGDVVMAFGESDEYSFLLKKDCQLYRRRKTKITTHIVSLFTSSYVFSWPSYFPQTRLLQPPSFDGRLVEYPTAKHIRDYFAWRQADTHVNNLYNTTFWACVLRGGVTEREAHERLRGTVSAQKNEMLFSEFGINYEREEAMFRKGTTLVWTQEEANETTTQPAEDVHDGLVSSPKGSQQNKRKVKMKRRLRTLHVDIIGDAFWLEGTAALPATAEAAPAVSGSCAAAAASDTTLPTSMPSAAPWQDPDRLEGVGCGRWALA